ncbi:lysozyme g-like [Eublepharis macularius]|uniref:Lysozyme g n=1 Tax=Eublepharis macularius TaxID=481883 RepID=A0AA97KRD7_EUBMA|nr:lysozyme g-like [Eublepharis macularius]
MAGVSFVLVFLFCLLYRTEGNVPGCSGPYGRIMDVQTTGAGLRTARAEGLKAGGVQASAIIAEKDLKNMIKYRTKIINVSKKTGIDAAVIAGIISRESHAGTALKNGWGDHGNGFGLMQVDKRYHKLIGAWNSEAHITQGTQILCNMINGIAKKFPGWTKAQQLKGGISAYNAGIRNVQTYDRMDIGTTGNDYANDVTARAQFYKKHGYN